MCARRSLLASRWLVDAWLPRAARAQPAARRPSASLTLRRAARRARAPARASSRGAASRAGDRVAIALPAGEAFARRAARLPAARRRRGPGRPAPAAGEAARADGGRARCVVDAPLGGDARAPPRRARERHDLDARRDRRPHLRHERRAEAGRADLRQLALERARLGGRARRRPATSAGSAALPLAHVGGLSILLRSAIYGTTRGRPRALRHRARARGAARPGRADARLARADDARAAARRRARASRPRCAARCSAARRSRRRCSSARAAAGVPVAPTYGMTEACSQVAHVRAPAVLHARRARPTTARSSSAARPSRPAAGPVAAHRRPRRARRARRGCTVTGPQGRHDRHRRRERRAGRGRGGARGAPRRRRGRRSTAAPTTEWGEAVVATRRAARRAAATADELRLRCCRERLAPFKVPKALRVRHASCRAPPPASCCAELRG